MGSTSGHQRSKTGGRTNRKSKSWVSRDRAGMSFIFVLAFFAVFGIIILTEVSRNNQYHRIATN